MKKKISLKDIANRIGVSAALVSYVLNNQKEGRIRKEVAEKIRCMAKELGYRPNQVARSLKTNKTFTIGLMVADISNPFSSALARYIEDEANRLNYTVIIGSSDEDEKKSMKLIDVFLDRQVDGLIILAVEHGECQLDYLKKNDIPFVLLDRYYPEEAVNYVVLDNFKAAFDATNLLIETGCSRIALITAQSSLHHMEERKRGYTAAMHLGKLKLKKELVREIRLTAVVEDTKKAINDLLSLPEPVDAILFTTNTLSTSGLRHINHLPIVIPRDLSIISFDETEGSDLFYAPLTYIRQPLEEMGKLATRLLAENIDQHKKNNPG